MMSLRQFFNRRIPAKYDPILVMVILTLSFVAFLLTYSLRVSGPAGPVGPAGPSVTTVVHDPHGHKRSQAVAGSTEPPPPGPHPSRPVAVSGTPTAATPSTPVRPSPRPSKTVSGPPTSPPATDSPSTGPSDSATPSDHPPTFTTG